MHTHEVPSPWNLVATLGTHTANTAHVLCAWLPPDGSFAWLFDDRGWLRRLDLRAWTEHAWPLMEKEFADAHAEFAAQFACVDEPFLWVTLGTYDTNEPCTVRVFALSERGAALRHSMNFALRAFEGPSGCGAEANAVIVRETSSRSVHIFAPDGTPLGIRPEETIAASIRGYWLQRGNRFDFFEHDESYVGGATVETDDEWVPLGVAGRSCLVLASGRKYAGESSEELALVDAERSSCRRINAMPFFTRKPFDFTGGATRLRVLVHRTGVVCSIPAAPDTPSAVYGLHRWDESPVAQLPFDHENVLHWLDDRRVFATDGGASMVYELASDELTTIDYPPVKSIALANRTLPMVVQHSGGLTRWWDIETASVIAESPSRPAARRALVGLRCGGTRALFCERPENQMVSLIERAIVRGQLCETWSARVELDNEWSTVTAFGDDHVIVQASAWASTESRAMLLSRASAKPVQLSDGDYPSGRLHVEGDALVLERYGPTKGAGNYALRRTRIAPDGAREILETRALDSVTSVATSSAAGCVGLAEVGAVLCVVSREGTSSEFRIETDSRFVAIADEVLRFVVKAKQTQLVYVIDANGIVGQWAPIDNNDYITVVAISPDGNTVAVGTDGGRVLVYCMP